jgi:membrane protein YqaA with SNARE-associated domain
VKKHRNLRVIEFIGAFVVLIFLLAVIFLNQIKAEIFQIISAYGYPAIIITTLIVETLAQPIGPEAPLLAGKLMGLNMVYMTSIIMLVSVIASFFNFHFGKFLYKRFNRHRNYSKYLAMYKKKGKYGLLIAALGPVPYVPFCWFSGAFKLSIKDFLYFGIFPRMIRIIVVSYVLHLAF